MEDIMKIVRSRRSVRTFDGTFGKSLTKETAGKLAGPLETVRWTPSAVNKQPWRVVSAPTVETSHHIKNRRLIP